MAREKIISLIATKETFDVPGAVLTFHGLLVSENALNWVIDEVYDDTLKVKYPRRERLLHMSKRGWRLYATVDREIE